MAVLGGWSVSDERDTMALGRGVDSESLCAIMIVDRPCEKETQSLTVRIYIYIYIYISSYRSKYTSHEWRL